MPKFVAPTVEADLYKPRFWVQRSCECSLVATLLSGRYFSPNFQELNRRRRRRGADFVTTAQLIIWWKSLCLYGVCARSVTQKFGWSPFLISLTLVMLCNSSHAHIRSAHNWLWISLFNFWKCLWLSNDDRHLQLCWIVSNKVSWPGMVHLVKVITIELQEGQWIKASIVNT